MNSRITIISTLLAAVLATGCAEQFIEDQQIQDKPEETELNYLKAFLEKDPGSYTKTSLDYDADAGIYKTLWSEEDSIAVSIDFDPEFQPYEIVDGKDSATATFCGKGGGRSYCAFYPYSMVRSFDEGTFSIEIPEDQPYTEGTFANEFFPMIAQSNSSTLNFTNLFAVLKINLTGQYFVKTVTVETNDKNLHLSGKATAAGRTLEMADDASNIVRVVGIDRQLDQKQPLELYFAIPAQTYTDGITITVYSKTGYSIKKTVSTLEFERSSVRNANVSIAKIDVGFEPTKSLKGSGTESSPYLINNMADLIFLQDNFLPDAYYKLTNDIDLYPACGEGIDSWMPIQYGGGRINTSGVIDGQNHKITGLYINDPELSYGVGLFGVFGGTMKDLTIVAKVSSENANVFCGDCYGAKFYNCTAEGEIQGGIGASAFGGAWDCTFIGCINKADMSAIGNFMAAYCAGICQASYDCKIINCVNEGTIEFKGFDRIRLIGGITGHAEGTSIVNCINSGDIISQYGSMTPAGITSELMSGSRAINCYNSGKIVSENTSAGIVGTNEGIIENCINIGANVAEETKFASICYENNGVVDHCSWLYEKESGKGCKDGVLTNSSKASVISSQAWTASELQSGSFLDELNEWVAANNTEDLPLQNWKYFNTDLYPSLDYEQYPHSPEDIVSNIFELVQDEFWVSPEASSIEVGIISNKEFIMGGLPGWIMVAPESKVREGLLTRLTLNIAAIDNEYYKRGASIKFTNADGAVITLNIYQHEIGFYASTDYSMDGKVRTIQKASVGNGIDIIVLGDAFSDRLIADGTYDKYMDMAVEAVFDAEPYKSYRDYFNVYAVYAVSRDEKYYNSYGRTALNCWFGEGTRIVGSDYDALQYALKAIPEDRAYESTIVVAVNEHRYSGTCYMYYDRNNDYGTGLGIAYCALNNSDQDFGNVVRHEGGGHGFAKLSDEYGGNGSISDREKSDYRTMFEMNGWYKNIDFTDDPDSVRWAQFIQDPSYASEGIGVFEGGATYDTGVYRPTENSIMRYNTGIYNAPSREAIYYRIHKLAFGADWTYDRNRFLEYDRMNIPSQPMKTKAGENDEHFIPLAPPVVRDIKELMSR